MKVKCLICGDILEGDKKGTFISCSCDKCYIDETPDYYRLGGDPENIATQNEDGYWIPLSEQMKKLDKEVNDTDSKDFYIFLDVDGVLNCQVYIERCYKRNGHFPMSMNRVPFYPTALKNLGRLYRSIKRRNLKPKLILSSTWRLSDIDYEIVNARLAEYGMFLTDKTPRDNGMYRGKEIEAYLKDKEYKDFIILDDDSADILPMYPNHLIKTNFKTGFDNKMLITAFNWLDNRNYIQDREEE